MPVEDDLPSVSHPSESLEDRQGGAPPVPGYEILKVIGAGGMGVVFEAVESATGRHVALKVLQGAQWATEKTRRRFSKEIRNAARLEHPNIVRVYDPGRSGGPCYFTMELVAGGVPLDDYVRMHGLDTVRILHLVHSVCRAVGYAHVCGIVHRDLKPQNILVSPDGQPHILDFGLSIALLDPEGRLTLSGDGEVPGSLKYMSPEQAEGRHDLEPTSDVYSLGVVLFKLLTGKWPHDMSGPSWEIQERIAKLPAIRAREVLPDLDPAIESVLAKALAQNREDRCANASELALALGAYLAASGQPSSTGVSAAEGRLRVPRGRRRAVSLLALALAGVLAGTTGLFRLHWRATFQPGAGPQPGPLAMDLAQTAPGQLPGLYRTVFCPPAGIDDENDCRFRPRMEENETFMDDEDLKVLGDSKEPSALRSLASRFPDLTTDSPEPRRVRALVADMTREAQQAARQGVRSAQMDVLDRLLLEVAPLGLEDKYRLHVAALSRTWESQDGSQPNEAEDALALAHYSHLSAACDRALQCDYVLENCGNGVALRDYVRRKLRRYDQLDPAQKNQLLFKVLYLTLKAEGKVPDEGRFCALYGDGEKQ